MKPLSLAVLANGPFAVPMFTALYQTPHRVRGLAVRPVRPAVGRKAPVESPLCAIARQRATPIIAPENINAADAQSLLQAWEPDLLVVCDYGQILSSATLGLARLGGINLHGSLLPKYRGAAPIHWAILQGESITGVTVIHMTPGLDAGPALAQASTPIGPDETTPQVEARLAELGAPLVCQVLDALANGTQTSLPQDQTAVTRAPRLKKEDGQIDWNRTAQQIHNQVRALEPWPKTFTSWLRSGAEPLRLIVSQTAVLPGSGCPLPGTIVERGERLIVACGAGALAIGMLQPSGKRAMSAAEFLRGHPVAIGDRLGTTDGAE